MAVFQATNPIEALKNGFGPSHKMEAEKSIGFASSHKSQITSSFEQNSCKQRSMNKKTANRKHAPTY